MDLLYFIKRSKASKALVPFEALSTNRPGQVYVRAVLQGIDGSVSLKMDHCHEHLHGRSIWPDSDSGRPFQDRGSSFRTVPAVWTWGDTYFYVQRPSWTNIKSYSCYLSPLRTRFSEVSFDISYVLSKWLSVVLRGTQWLSTWQLYYHGCHANGVWRSKLVRQSTLRYTWV